MIDTRVDNEGHRNLYINRSPDNYIKDGEARALYWVSYRRKYESLVHVIVPGNVVPAEEEISILANNRLSPFDFDLRKKDRQSVDGVEQPGKSACVHFSDNPHEVCGAVMDRDLKRQDAMYVASVTQILSAGWVPVFAPTPNQPLHVRLVPTEFVGGDPLQPSIRIRRSLVEIFNSRKIRH